MDSEATQGQEGTQRDVHQTCMWSMGVGVRDSRMRTESSPQAVTVLVSPVLLADFITNEVESTMVAVTQATSERAERESLSIISRVLSRM